APAAITPPSHPRSSEPFASADWSHSCRTNMRGASALLVAQLYRRPAMPGELIRNTRSDDGAALGELMAKWCNEAEPTARLRMPELPPRCNSCAFRAGRHVANGSPVTQMTALKCVMQGAEFQCHEPARDGTPCSGWAIFMLAKDSADDFGS